MFEIINNILTITLPFITAYFSYSVSKHQYNTELEKVKIQSLNEITKIKEDMNAQAELYERNKQTDYISMFFEKLIDGDEKVIDRLERLGKIEQSGTFKNNKHPAVNKRNK